MVYNIFEPKKYITMAKKKVTKKPLTLDGIKELRVSKLAKRQEKSHTSQLLDENEKLRTMLDASLQIQDAVNPTVFTLNESVNEGEAVAVVLASDFHIEELVIKNKVNGLNEYNLVIAQERTRQFFQNTIKLLKKEQQQTRIDTLVLALLGDFISSNIHEALLEICQVRPIEAIITAENWLIGGIDTILNKTSVDIVIPCHFGNHSRVTKKVHIATEKENSLEYFMYHHMKNYFKDEPRVKFHIADGYLSYLKVFDNYTICFQHGHAIRFQGGIGGLTIPANKAIAQWEKMGHADLYCFGHWHSFFDGGNFIVNGSLIGFNEYATFIKAGFEKPKQAFFLIDKKRNSKTVVCPIMFDI